MLRPLTYLILLKHVGFAQDLHGIDVAGVFLLHQPHLTESTFADDFQWLEVVHCKTGAFQAKELGLLESMLSSHFLLLQRGDTTRWGWTRSTSSIQLYPARRETRWKLSLLAAVIEKHFIIVRDMVLIYVGGCQI